MRNLFTLIKRAITRKNQSQLIVVFARIYLNEHNIASRGDRSNLI